MRRAHVILALATFALAIAPAAAAPKRTVVFGAAVSLSGSLQKEGVLTKEGYDFWMRYVNAHGGLRVGTQRYAVAIHYADDQSNAQTTAKLVEGLISDDKVDFILGPYASGPTFAAATVAERHAVPERDRARRQRSRLVERRPRTRKVRDALSRRDFIYLVLILSAFGKAHWFLVMAAVGAPIFFFVLLGITLGGRRTAS